MARNARLLQLSRKVHLYFGLFISPALLFFAFTGAYQTLGLHEGASDYRPPALLASLGQIHKKQTYVLPVRRPDAGPQGPQPRPGVGPEGPQRHPGTLRADATTVQDTSSSSRQTQSLQHNRPDNAGENGQPRSNRQRSGHEGALNAAASPGGDASPASTQNAPSSPGRTQLPLRAKQAQHLPLKLFFVLVSLGLLTSTVTGIYMAYKYDRNRILVTGLLIAGVAIPLLLLRY